MLVLYVVWGSTYLGIAVAVDTIPPFLMAAARFALAGALLLAWSLARERGAFAWPTRREWRDSAIVGALLLGGGMGMVAFGEQTIPSGITALLIAMMPVWVAVFGGILLGERLPADSRSSGSSSGSRASRSSSGRRRSVAPGALDPLGLAGRDDLADLLVARVALRLASARACPASRSWRRAPRCYRRRRPPGHERRSPVSRPASRLDGVSERVDRGLRVPDRSSAACSRSRPTAGCCARRRCQLIATYAYVNPVVAVVLGAIVLHEPIEPRTLVAGAVIVVGVALIVTARGRMQRPATVASATIGADGAATVVRAGAGN